MVVTRYIFSNIEDIFVHIMDFRSQVYPDTDTWHWENSQQSDLISITFHLIISSHCVFCFNLIHSDSFIILSAHFSLEKMEIHQISLSFNSILFDLGFDLADQIQYHVSICPYFLPILKIIPNLLSFFPVDVKCFDLLPPSSL